VKQTREVLAALARRVDDTWHLHLDAPNEFAFTTPLLPSTSSTLDASELMSWAQGWHRWHLESTGPRPGMAGEVVLGSGTRRVDGISYPGTPDRLTVTGLDAAAAIAGAGRSDRLARGRLIAAQLRDGHSAISPDAVAAGARRLADASATDLDLTVRTLAWFSGRPAEETAGRHPREIPVAGVHGKWLESHQRLLETLLGRPLDLIFGYPPQFRFRYADPAHLSAGGREHDIAVVGDTAMPAYQPTVILVAENKHTARNFPPTPGLLVIDGSGGAAHPLGRIGWVQACPDVVYWGDLDADGLEILDGVRRSGLPQTRSLLMDLATYEAFEAYGSWHDVHGKALTVANRKELTTLTADEAAVYVHLTDTAHDRTRRIEQERIPLPHAKAALDSQLATLLAPSMFAPSEHGLADPALQKSAEV